MHRIRIASSLLDAKHVPDLVQPNSNGAAAWILENSLSVSEYLDVDHDLLAPPKQHISLASLPSDFAIPWQPSMGEFCFEWELIFHGNLVVRLLKLPC